MTIKASALSPGMRFLSPSGSGVIHTVVRVQNARARGYLLVTVADGRSVSLTTATSVEIAQ